MIGAMEWFSLASHFPLVIIPLRTSIVLVIGSPEAEPAQPAQLIVGTWSRRWWVLPMVKLTGPHAWAAAAAVGLAVLGDVRHRNVPSACRDQSAAGGFNNAALVVFDRARPHGRSAADYVYYVWHRWIRRQSWPLRWF